MKDIKEVAIDVSSTTVEAQRNNEIVPRNKERSRVGETAEGVLWTGAGVIFVLDGLHTITSADARNPAYPVQVMMGGVFVLAGVYCINRGIKLLRNKDEDISPLPKAA